MAQQTNLAEIILEKASELFRDQGYAATTIKQIAQASGCTTAALYYYYEGGKSEILSEVIRSFKSGDELLAEMEECQSLPEFISKFTSILAQNLPKMADQIGWLLLQFSNLPAEEKTSIQERILSRQAALKKQLICFTDDEAEAEKLAWMIFNTFMGYQQIFLKAEIGQRVDFDIQTYGQFIASMFETSRI